MISWISVRLVLCWVRAELKVGQSGVALRRTVWKGWQSLSRESPKNGCLKKTDRERVVQRPRSWQFWRVALRSAVEVDVWRITLSIAIRHIWHRRKDISVAMKKMICWRSDDYWRLEVLRWNRWLAASYPSRKISPCCCPLLVMTLYGCCCWLTNGSS